MIHHAKLENSPRLQRFLMVLNDYGKPMSTRDVQFLANVCNAHTCAAELRAQGVQVDVERIHGHYYYSLGDI